VPHVFTGKKVGFSAQPDLLGGFVEIVNELGAEVAHLSAPCHAHHLQEDLAEIGYAIPEPLFSPKHDALSAEFRRCVEAEIDLVLGNTELRNHWLGGAHGTKRTPVFGEFGFPSFFDHALADRPFLGFRGWIGFVDRMANALMSARRGNSGPPEIRADNR